jgi:hypothetical protein
MPVTRIHPGSPQLLDQGAGLFGIDAVPARVLTKRQHQHRWPRRLFLIRGQRTRNGSHYHAGLQLQTVHVHPLIVV